MTVQELINELKQQDPSAEIYFNSGRNSVTYAEIYVEADSMIVNRGGYAAHRNIVILDGNFTPY